MKKITLGASVIGGAAAICLLLGLSGASANLKADSESPNNIIGSWDITIPGTPFRILRTYDPAGGVVDAYAFPPFTFTAGPLINSAGHGVWGKAKGGQIAAVVKYFQLDPSKNAQFAVLDSIGVVTETINLSPGGDTYTSTFTTQVFNPSGNLIINNAGATHGTRIKLPQSNH